MTDDYVLFYLSGSYRDYLIERHRFYVEQAQSRLLGQFLNIEADAQKAADDWLANHTHLFDPDLHNPSDFDERAHAEMESFYLLLEEMRETTRLSVVASMYHDWDKQLREWLVREINHWHRGSEVRSQVWSQDFIGLADLFDALGWAFRTKSYFPKLDACRLLVNVYKHGEGKSFTDLKERFPEYLNSLPPYLQNLTYVDYTDLRVNDAQIQEFSDAIVSFWNDLPERTTASGDGTLPLWFEKAFLKDSKKFRDNGHR